MCWLRTRACRIKPSGGLSTHEVRELMKRANFTRRHVLTGAAGAAAATVAGCLGGGEDGEQFDGPTEQRDTYVVAYHWGYAAFDEDGQELDLIEIPPNTELTVHAVNDHAYDAFDELPDAVAAELEEFDALSRLKAKVEAGELPEPSGDQTVEEVYEAAHGHGHDHENGHGHDDDGHGHGEDDHHGEDGHGHDEDDHHGDNGHGHEGGKLDHGFRLRDLDFDVPADADEPTTGSTLFEEPGTYQASCTVPCGEYHSYQREDLVRVTEE